MKTIGFIGTGYMGSALAEAAAKSGLDINILLANRSQDKAEKLAQKVNGTVATNLEVAEKADYLFLGVKPQILPTVYEEIRETLRNRKDRFVIISVIAGKTVQSLAEMFDGAPIIRFMPNMPVSVGSGLSFYAFADNVTAEEREFFLKLMDKSGIMHESTEAAMLSIGGVSGCAPAFAAMFLEALADGAVTCGVSRRDAYVYAAEMMKGTAELYLANREHPGVIKDSVCSPAGISIEGVRILEQRAFRSAVIDALVATFNKKLGTFDK